MTHRANFETEVRACMDAQAFDARAGERRAAVLRRLSDALTTEDLEVIEGPEIET
jgi:hypothetical protein